MAQPANQFLELVRRAADETLCTAPYCTTCGNREFRNALAAIAGGEGWDLCRQLAEIEISDLLKLGNWDECIRIAFQSLPWPGQHEKVLEAWLVQLDANVRFADIVLFYIVRALPFGRSVGAGWIERCVSIATALRDESLVESLVWTLGRDVLEHSDLRLVAAELSRDSFKIRKALTETGCE